MPRNPLLARIHIAKKELGLDDAAYRTVLERVTGKSSSADMTDAERRAVLAAFGRMGWQGASRRSRPQIRKIRALWKDLEDIGALYRPGKAGLRAFVRHMTGKSRLSELTVRDGIAVIEALKSWYEREKEERDT